MSLYMDFDALYKALGQRDQVMFTAGQPIFTSERFQDILEQYKAFEDPSRGRATIQTLFGHTITMERGHIDDSGSCVVTYTHSKLGTADLKVLAGGHFQIYANSIFDIAGPCTDSKIEQMLRHCAFRIHHEMGDGEIGVAPGEKVVGDWNMEWRNSTLRERLVLALQKNAMQVRDVKRIVCYNLGPISKYSKTCYIQYLAACTIAKVLGKAQATGREICQIVEMFAQDESYTDKAREALAKMDPPIIAVDHKSNEALTKINSNTFIVSIDANPSIVESAIDKTYPDGPAGLLSEKASFNAEKEFNCRVYKETESPMMYGMASESKWQYKSGCICEPITGDLFFEREIWAEKEGSEGNDENTKVVGNQTDTELLLRKR